jgi:hypothetical protein
MEEWVEVYEFPNYSVSNYGRVYSHRNNIILKESIDRNGYCLVTLTAPGIRSTQKVHRLVANAFVPTLDFNLEVNHIDRDKQNNNETNLEWVTHQDNVKHAVITGRHLGRPGKQIVIDNTGEVFNSITECAKFLGTTQANISCVLTGKNKSWKGYTFSYVE